ncbi:MAG: TetR/AcrR family transcriptional regulator [Mycobacteriales bacterium]
MNSVPAVIPQPCRRPGRPRSEQAEQAALQATLELLASHGVHGFGMGAVAAAAGVAKTTVYRRWPNKNELILDALIHLKGELVRPSGDSVRGDLIAILRRMLARPRNDIAMRITPQLMAESECCPELLAQFRERVVRPRREIMYGVLNRGIDEGLIREGTDVELTTDLLTSAMLTCHVSRAEVYSAKDVEFFVDMVLAGLAPGR